MVMPGNLHRACEDLTRLKLADLLVAVSSSTDTATTLVLRAHDADAPAIRALLGWPDPANKPYYQQTVDERWVPPRSRS